MILEKRITEGIEKGNVRWWKGWEVLSIYNRLCRKMGGFIFNEKKEYGRLKNKENVMANDMRNMDVN